MFKKMSAPGFAALLLVALTLSGRPAMAFHQSELEEVKSLAHDLQDSAETVADTAEDQAHHFTAGEQNMIAAVNRFAQSARRFHGTIETYFASPAAVRATLARLNEDATVVSGSIHRAHAMESVYDDWDNCRRLLRKINYKMDADADEGFHAHTEIRRTPVTRVLRQIFNDQSDE